MPVHRFPAASIRAVLAVVEGEARGLDLVVVVSGPVRQAGDGALLFTTGMSAMIPLAVMGNVGIAQAGLRYWASAVREDLAKDGVYVGHVSVGLPIIPGSGDGDPDSTAERWFQLAQARDTFEVTVGF